MIFWKAFKTIAVDFGAELDNDTSTAFLETERRTSTTAAFTGKINNTTMYPGSQPSHSSKAIRC